jgi:DNA recombination protein RmuC
VETLLSFITGCLVAGLATWILISRRVRPRLGALSADLETLRLEKAQFEERNRQIPALAARVQELESESRDAGNQLVGLRETIARTGAELDASKSQNEKLVAEVSMVQGEHRAVADVLARTVAELSGVRAELDFEKKQIAEKVALLEAARNSLSDHFQTLASAILEKKGEQFSELNKQGLGHLLDPLKIQIKSFQEKAEAIQLSDTEQQAQLRSELAQMKELNLRMTAEAHALATALRGEAKVRGNWGEMVLESALERSGLREGKDYRREVSITTEDGRRRPDVVIYLPQDRHLVIDSKVSLNAYTRYINAEDDLERAKALKEHSNAVASRIRELSDKDYYQLPGLNSPEVVFMFIPLESAFVEALRGDEALFEMAIERNVLVATPTTLLTSLNIVRQLWRFEEQNASSAELAMRAGKVYKKLNTFLQSMQKVGGALDSAKNAYSTAMGQLYSGPGNLIKQASEFKRLGVSVQGSLPPQIVEKAMLEIEFLPDEDPAEEATGTNESIVSAPEDAGSGGEGEV